jgi:hypothetical protein
MDYYGEEIGDAARFMAETAEVLTIWFWPEPYPIMCDDGTVECDVAWCAQVAVSEDICISYGKDWVL